MRLRSNRSLAFSLFRRGATALQALRKLVWSVTGRPPGVHAVALTSSGTILLVRLTYAPNWRLPGGGRKRNEPEAEAILRELREEIGLSGHTSIERLNPGTEPQLQDSVLGAVFVVRGVAYSPAASLEIDSIREFPIDALPADLSPHSRAWVHRALEGRSADGACLDAPSPSGSRDG